MAVIVAAMATPFAELSNFSRPEWGILLVDLALLGVLLRVVLTTDRLWVLFAAGFHLATILTHIASLMGPKLLPEAYAAASVFWAYLVLLSLAVGSLLNPNRVH